MIGGDERSFGHPQSVELGGGDFPVIVVHLVDGQDDGFVGAPQSLRHRFVGRRNALDSVGKKDDDRGGAHGHIGLLLDTLGNMPLRVILQTAGVNQQKGPAFPGCAADQAVARCPRHWGHDGVAPGQNAVEQR